MAASRLPSDPDREELVELTRLLVRTPSVVREGEGEEAVARIVADRLERSGFEVQVEEVEPGRPNVIGIHDSGEPGPTLLFEAHSDVVTEGDPDTWTRPPFEGVIEDGRLYGRGACDTKGNLAAAILALGVLREAGFPPRGRLMLACPVDEEGLMAGIRHLVQQGWADGVDGAVICEPEENQVCIAQKGALRLRIVVEGEMAHGAMPLTGLNPLPAVAELIRGLEDLERRVIEWAGLDELLGFPSVTPTVIRAPRRGEAQLNVVPGDAELLVDVRTVRGVHHQAILDEVHRICREVADRRTREGTQGWGGQLRERLRAGMSDDLALEVSVEVLDERPWTETDREDPIVRAAARAVREVTGREPIYNGVPGATDGTFLWALRDIPIVTTGAGDRFVPHKRDEWVDLDQLHETARIYARTAIEYWDVVGD